MIRFTDYGVIAEKPELYTYQTVKKFDDVSLRLDSIATVAR